MSHEGLYKLHPYLDRKVFFHLSEQPLSKTVWLCIHLISFLSAMSSTAGSEIIKLAESREDVSINTFTGDANHLYSNEENQVESSFALNVHWLHVALVLDVSVG